MKVFYQTILGLALILAILSSSLTYATPLDDNKSDESLLSENSESDESVPNDIQQDYLNVANYVTPSPPWWWN
ncbi:uncharacterized protein LOC122623380 [Drosophila teissieri]|uniref:uncharacterized protein LOC122623380 n=1 Tax=Drosophila teissieri TaxID=7243 RepID=UPI001CBA0011|nr:uncharacterized protein LOC122623380 [Drosophila teissieri]XP_043658446.1 uncharacterized protein LOC122623380 [Drosophila teissieri]XP_043658447.1 uncharacterized protein LOC122623380 [Drosophila teissieri]